MPLPINSIADERSTALGNVMSEPLDRPDLDEPDRHGIRTSLGRGDQKALGALPPEVIDNNIDARGELLLEAVFQERSRPRRGEWSHRPREPRQICKGVGVTGGRDDFLRSEMLGDLHREAARRAGRAVDQHGFPGLEPARSV